MEFGSMREQWKAVQACLQVFLEEDRIYVQFLESIEKKLARLLRFKRCSRNGSLVDSIAFDRFVQSAAQLQHLHVFFQEKLKPIAELLARKEVRSIDVIGSNLVNIVADMFCTLRFQYGQQLMQCEAIRSTLEAALAKEHTEWDGEILKMYLETQDLTVDNLVSRPLQRFHEVVEVVEVLSTHLAEDRNEETKSNDSDVESNERLNYALQLMHIIQENKRYIDLVKALTCEENELIALQTCFYGNGADVLDDLSNNKLLLHGEVYVMGMRDQNDSNVESSEVVRFEKFYAHCFQDGTLVCSKQQSTELRISYEILYCLQLKQDAVFLEIVPASMPLLEASEEARALTLICRDRTLIFAWKDAMENQRWADMIGGLLETNGSRAEELLQSRSIEDLPICNDISTQVVSDSTMPTKFASFYDDHLPGVFWMAPCKGSNVAQWELVEIVFYVRWLLVFKIEGWKRHSALLTFDTHSRNMEIVELPRAQNEWSLVISNGCAATFVSLKRTRIDFWFDQVWKAAESAQAVVRQAEKETNERLALKKNVVYMQHDCRKKAKKVAGKKRKVMEPSDHSKTSVVLLNANERSMLNSSPASCCNSNPVNGTDEECGEPDRGLMMTIADEKQSVTPLVKRVRCSSDKLKPVSAMACTEENEIFAAITLAAVRNPEQKRPKRKLNNIAVIPAQRIVSTLTDDCMTEIDNTQLPTNDEPAENKSKYNEVRIILTGIELSALIRKKIDMIAGAVYEDDIEQATHIIAPKGQLKRTVKLLCGISRCAHVLDVRWLEESASVGVPVLEQPYCLKDVRAETKWQFSLRKTMYDFTPEQRQQLFGGHQMFITNHKSVLPPAKDLVRIVECAGGTAVTKGSAGPDDIVITSKAALAIASFRKALTRANPERIYCAELILSSILQQCLDFDKNRLEQTSDESCRHK